MHPQHLLIGLLLLVFPCACGSAPASSQEVLTSYIAACERGGAARVISYHSPPTRPAPAGDREKSLLQRPHYGHCCDPQRSPRDQDRRPDKLPVAAENYDTFFTVPLVR